MTLPKHILLLRSLRVTLCAVTLLVGCAAEEAIQGSESAIVGGVEVGTCGFPTTVLVGGGCTGTLIHPRVVVSAAHCGMATSVEFGERRGQGMQRSVQCSRVPQTGGTGSDVMFCVLSQPVDLPITPVLYGCELDQLSVGGQVVITGFGLTSFGNNASGGIQRWSDAPIRDIRSDITLIGTPQASACPGDSGGPVFIRMSDQSWRVFGTVSGGTTGIPCNGDGAYPRIERHVPWFEQNFNIDITPCHDLDGSWNPGPDCGGFFAGDHTGGQSWSNMCAGAPVGPASATCGAPGGNTPIPDASVPDASIPDASVPDASLSDAGGPTPIPDAGSVDASSPDTSLPDVGANDDQGAGPDAEARLPDGGTLEGGCSISPTAQRTSPLLWLMLVFGLRRRRTR